MSDLVSVIVPVYNTELYIERCIDSVLQQSYMNLELILVDDGSTDSSGEICDRYAEQDSRIKVMHQNNSGVCAARNIGLKNVQGKFFLFLDSDDSLEKYTLEQSIKKIEADKADVLIFGWREIKEGKVIRTGEYGNEVLSDSLAMVKEILSDRHIYGGGYPNKLWRTEALFINDEVIPAFDIQLFYVEDMEWVIRMLLRVSKASTLNQIFYNYYLRDDSASTNLAKTEKRLVGYHDTTRKIVEDLVEFPDVQEWFEGIYFSELINSIIDARLKNQREVYQKLYNKLAVERERIMKHPQVTSKVKIRYIAIRLMHIIKII